MSIKQILLVLCILLLAGGVSAEVPNVINYQGRLTDAVGDPVADAVYFIKFTIYDDAVAGTDLWNSTIQPVTTVNGIFSYQLGSNVTLPIGIFSDTSRYLGIIVGSDPEISPRTRFISVAYAFNAKNSDLALDADALDGLTPSYYLDWNNMINIPAGFADGTDDENADWSSLTGVPAGFADGIDDVDTDWSSLTGVPAGFADGVDDENSDWSSLTGVPAGFADGIDNVDTDWSSLTGVPAGFADGVDNENADWSSLTGVPAGFADGIDDTTSNLEWSALTSVPAGFADGVDNVDADWSNLTGVPAGFADGIDDTTSSLKWGALTGVPAGFVDGVDDIGTGDITGVTAGSGMSGGGTSGTVTLNIATSGVTATHLGSGSVGSTEIQSLAIQDSHVSNSANIATTKISGTAVNLSSDQTITGAKTFGDSTMIINNDGISIGDNEPPSTSYLMRLERKYNTASNRFGVRSKLDNTLDGYLQGASYIIGNTTGSDGGGSRIGVQVNVNNRLNSWGVQYGIYSKAGNLSKTTGTSYGVYTTATAGTGSYAYGLYSSASGTGVNYAGYFNGHVQVTGILSKGGGAFKIDHPLDPENKYLQHSFVESPDMMNIYNGNIELDADGTATVEMPSYFDVLNMDFRYQLTAIGAPGPNLYIAEKISGNTFRIAGGESFSEVSWQVTGIRQDRWAEVNRIKVEVDKPINERGTYIHSKAYGMPIEMDTNYEQMKEAVENQEER